MGKTIINVQISYPYSLECTIPIGRFYYGHSIQKKNWREKMLLNRRLHKVKKRVEKRINKYFQRVIKSEEQ